MKYTPILFKSEMVRAILAGTKTQTRRIVKPQPTGNKAQHSIYSHRCWLDDSGRSMDCPHGAPGDRLWVREDHFRFGHWEPVAGIKTKGGRQKWMFVGDTPEVRYNDNPPEAYRKGRHHETPDYRFWHKRLGRFMPRAFSRITLELTAVRAERLNDISVDDALAEGVQCTSDGPWCAVAEYRSLWESINGAGSWDANPWVWVIEFRRIDA